MYCGSTDPGSGGQPIGGYTIELLINGEVKQTLQRQHVASIVDVSTLTGSLRCHLEESDTIAIRVVPGVPRPYKVLEGSFITVSRVRV